jgi:hypothetical protein
MNLEFLKQFFENYSKIKFHENPSSGSRVVQCGRMDGRADGQTETTKHMVTLRHFAKAPKYIRELPTYTDRYLKQLHVLRNRESKCRGGWVLFVIALTACHEVKVPKKKLVRKNSGTDDKSTGQSGIIVRRVTSIVNL